MANKKIAVILFNLGGPDSLKNVRKFLFNLFYDPAIINLPNPIRWFLAHFISITRYKGSQKLYALMGGKSPILSETTAQADKLVEELQSDDDEYEVFVSMRYFKPYSKDVIKLLENYSPDEIILLPLYPQFSTTTTASSLDDFNKNLARSSVSQIPVKTVCCYSNDDDFIMSHIANIEKCLEPDVANIRILFSAHGLPQKVVDEGDPYQFQIESSVNSIMKLLSSKYPGIDHRICYQSKVGPMKWLEPSTETEIKLAAKDQKNIILVPIAFVSEHIETLVELDVEYKEIADDLKVSYIRVPALGTDKIFIKSLAKQVRAATAFANGQISPILAKKICKNGKTKCPCNL